MSPSLSFRSWLCLLALLVAGVVGCGVDNPGNWPAEKVSAYLADHFEITDVVLTPTADGFSGTGKRADGETLNISVTMVPEKSEFRWDAKGDRGFVEEGDFALVSPNG